MDKQITIRMPKELLAKWLAALRSGEYQQGRRQLEINGSYCCLGVLQVVAAGDVERASNGRPHLDPSSGWLADHGVEFAQESGEPTVNPYLPPLHEYAMDSNDMRGRTFAEIADAIEACAEGV